jgi:group I intron endonuclease
MSRPVVYKIESADTGKIYVGSSKDFASRKNGHLHFLRHGSHQNKRLQEHFNQYGEGDLLFLEIEVAENEGCLKDREQFYIDSLRPYFNAYQSAYGPTGYAGYSDEFRENARKRALGNTTKRGKKISKEQILSMTGENHVNCKLTDSQVAEIRKLYQPPKFQQVRRQYSTRRLAEMFSVSSAQIRRIVNYTDRKNITV